MCYDKKIQMVKFNIYIFLGEYLFFLYSKDLKYWLSKGKKKELIV